MKIKAIQRNVRIGALEEFGFPADTRLDPLGEFGLKEVEFHDLKLLDHPQIVSCLENGIITVVHEEEFTQLDSKQALEKFVEELPEQTDEPDESTQDLNVDDKIETTEEVNPEEAPELLETHDVGETATEIDLTGWDQLTNKEATDKIKDIEDFALLGALSERGKTKGVKLAASSRVQELLKDQ